MTEIFQSLVQHYNKVPQQIQILWDELTKCYSGKNRYYHTLGHLDQLLEQLLPLKDKIRDIDAVLFALYYHDAVYQVLRKDNEERSAALAVKRLVGIGVPKDRIDTCKKHILATKSHIISDDSDTNHFTDADLSILGQDWNKYKTYYQQVRKEYSVYPDAIYKPGRKKVLEHFLQMPRIFKTEAFYQRFEGLARNNIEKELSLY